MELRSGKNSLRKVRPAVAGMSDSPDVHVERTKKFCRLAPYFAETDEEDCLAADLTGLHRRGPQFILTPDSLLLVAHAIGKTTSQSHEHSKNVLRDWNR